jgi:hypothetical protein
LASKLLVMRTSAGSGEVAGTVADAGAAASAVSSARDADAPESETIAMMRPVSSFIDDDRRML